MRSKGWKLFPDIKIVDLDTYGLFNFVLGRHLSFSLIRQIRGKATGMSTRTKPYPSASGSPKCCSGEGGSLRTYQEHVPFWAITI